MNKIKSLNDLRNMQQAFQSQLNLREKGDNPESYTQIKVGMATCGIASGARETMNAFLKKIEDEKIPAMVTQAGCMGYCHSEPTVEIIKRGQDPVVFGHVDAKKAVEIVDKYIKNGELLEGIIPVNYQTID